MFRKPDSAWYASGLRWIASGLATLADRIDREAPPTWPREVLAGDEFLLEARHRAQRGL